MPIQYELFYLVGDTKEADLPHIKGEVEKIVADQGATWLEKEVIEKRKLAYPVKKEVRGTYIAKRFTLPDQDERSEGSVNTVAEMNRALQLYHDVLRFIIVRADDLPSLDSREEALKNMPVASPRRPAQSRGGMMRRPYGGGSVPRPASAPAAPVISTPPSEEKPEVSSAEIDKQLDEVLDKKLPNM